MRTYFTYIITNKPKGVLYVGVTNDLERRISEHKNKICRGFAVKYNLDKLVYFEDFSNADGAIFREKELKGFRREKKVRLIESINKDWHDLSSDWWG